MDRNAIAYVPNGGDDLIFDLGAGRITALKFEEISDGAPGVDIGIFMA